MTRYTRLLTIALLIAVPRLAGASEHRLTLAPESTEVSFSLDATGEDVLGHLYLRSGEILFDPETAEAAGRIEIDAVKTETGNAKRDKKMHKAVLKTADHPLILFEPQRFEGALPGSGTGDVTLIGTVTLLGVEHELALPATVDVTGERLSFESSFIVPYVDWGLHDPSWFVLKVAKEVSVKIDAQGVIGTMSASLGFQPSGSR